MSFKAEVTTDDSGTWTANGLRFATTEEAQSYVNDLWSRWTLVQQTRVVPSEDAVNVAWQQGRVQYKP